MQTLAGRIIAEVMDKETKTASGLHLPENQYNQYPTRVLARSVGKEYIQRSGKRIKPPCQEGDFIYIKKIFKDIKIKGKRCLFVTFADVVGVEEI